MKPLKTVWRVLSVLLAAVLSVLAIQWLIKKLYDRWKGDYISLYDEDINDSVPQMHVTTVRRRFRG